jgi:DnaJ-class molecular chaperone
MKITYLTGVSTIEELKKMYKQLAKKFHPDLNLDKDTTMIW